MWRRNFNNETEKSEQTVFAQFSVSLLRFLNYVSCEGFQRLQHILDHAELLFLRISIADIHDKVIINFKDAAQKKQTVLIALFL